MKGIFISYEHILKAFIPGLNLCDVVHCAKLLGYNLIIFNGILYYIGINGEHKILKLEE